jgi:SSS family solute:Na+ symporter
MTFALIDWIVVLIYAVGILIVGFHVIKQPQTSEGYFLAGRNVRWPFIGASMLVSNISAEHFVGLSGLAFAIGWAAASWEFVAIYCMVPLIILFLPFYVRTRVFTIPEFLEKRYSPGSRTLYSAYMIAWSVFTRISIALLAAGIAFHEMMGWNQWTVIILVGLVVALYTMKGGLRVVIYTDFIQTGVLLFAGIILAVIGMQAVGGLAGLKAGLPPDMISMIKPIDHPELPWLGFWIALIFAGGVNWSTDQVLVQRVLAAPNLNEGRRGVVFCQFLKLLTPFVLVLPGLLGFVLYRDAIAKPDLAYPVVLKNLMPHGLLGLAIAGLAAALMGHLSATYNSVATLVTRDFYLKWRPNASQKSQISVGRWAVLIVFLLGVLWVPVIQQFEMMWSYLIRIGIYLLMPYTAVFLAGVLWRRANVAGAWWAVIVGLTLAPVLAVDSKIHFLPIVSESPVFRSYLNSSLLSLAACVIAIVVGSLLTPPPPKECLKNTTFSFRKWWGGSYLDEVEPQASIVGDWRLWFVLVVSAVTVIFWVMR